ncbi:MAG: HYC_CC_PP family protein [Niabella sp.]
MKKFTIIAVLMFYSLAVFGVSVNYFYCCGKLKKVSIQLDQPPVNHQCHMKGGKDCCKNKSVDVKIDQQQQFSQQIVFEPLFFAITNSTSLSYHIISLTGEQQNFCLQNRPPPLSPTPLHILHAHFRI